MNRVPRRPAAALPPLRGRAAAFIEVGGGDTPVARPRLRLPTSSGRTSAVKVEVRTPCDGLHPFWGRLLEVSPGLQSGLIQSVSQAFLPRLRAWVEVDGIAPSQCPKAFLPQPISI